jgi:ABC-type nitrate/sulfonate/bicarbonate transport system substrate-binding protein
MLKREVVIAPPGGPSHGKGMVQAIKAGGLIFFSAIRGNDPVANFESNDTKEQARQGFENLKVLLTAARTQRALRAECDRDRSERMKNYRFQIPNYKRSLARASLLSLFLVLSLAQPTMASQAGRELKEVRVAYPPSMASVTLMTGIKQRFFDEQGLRPVLLVIASDLALKSQVVGEIDYTLFGGGSGMLAAAQGLPIKNVHLPHKFADLTLVARPEFKTVAQLRGKKIGVSSFSGAVYNSTRAMLAAGGLDPDKDVVVIAMGREPIRLQALFSGSIDATPLPVPLHAVAEEKGFSLLADIEGKFEVPFSGITVTDKKLRDNPDEVKRFIRAMVKAGLFFLNHRAESVALYMDWLKLSKPIAENAYARSLKTVSPDGFGKDSAIKTQLGIIKQTTGKDVKPEDVIDFTLLKQVLAEMK